MLRTGLYAAAAGVFALVLGLPLMVVLLLSPATAADCSAGQPSGPGPTTVSGVPQSLLALYNGAAARYQLGADGWAYLAAINEVETNFGQNLSTSSRGAVGWMQFEPDTWLLYGVTPAGDPAPDGPAGWNDPADAIYSAADYLHASGAPADWQQAVFTYNHASWYVAQVTGLAQQYEHAAGQPVTASQPGATAQSVAAGTGVPGAGTAPAAAVSAPPGECAGAVSGPTTPGAVATIEPNGIAAIPTGAPPQVQRAIAAGNQIINTFYSQERRANMLSHVQDSYDCSGSTDWVLANAGLSSSLVDVGGGVAGVSGMLEQYGQNGPGQWITVFGSSGHAFIEVAGIVLDTAHYGPVVPASVPDSYPPDDPYNGGPTSGPRWQPASIIPSQLKDGSTWSQRHPAGL